MKVKKLIKKLKKHKNKEIYIHDFRTCPESGAVEIGDNIDLISANTMFLTYVDGEAVCVLTALIKKTEKNMELIKKEN